MHSGIEDIPPGWALCDGKEYEWNGIKTMTPDLSGRFIKAVSDLKAVGSVDNSDLNADNEFYLEEKHLPEHHHPHEKHRHSF